MSASRSVDSRQTIHAPEDVTELHAGIALGGYRIEALLGSGAMGSVYSAHGLHLDRRVAIKVLRPELAGDERFRPFVFADIRGYTAYTREHGDEAAASLARSFAAIAAEAGPAFNGHLQELRGDEALLVFGSAREALRFAVELQRRVGAAALARGVGVGLDAGEAVPVDHGDRGGALNRAARLCALARPGEILATDAVAELAGRGVGFAYGLRRVEG